MPSDEPRGDYFSVGKGRAAATAGAVAVGFFAASWLFWLSGALGVVPGGPVVTRSDVFFNTDTALWLDRVRGRILPTPNPVHPLRPYVWDPLGRALRKGLALAAGRNGSGEVAALRAGRLLNAAFAGLGVACLWASASGGGRGRVSAAAGLVVYLLFSGNALVAIPEHFGISHGLLSVTFAVAVSERLTPRRKAAALGAMTAAAGGLTVSNALFPLGCLAMVRMRERERLQWGWRWKGVGAVAVAVGVIAAVALGATAAERVSKGRSRVARFAHMRAVREPGLALLYALHGLTDPAVGPTPRVILAADGPRLTYEPLTPWACTLTGAVATAAWVALLASCVGACILENSPGGGRLWLELTVPWVGFNLLFHNLWGDEFFLFSPHWSWALGAVLLRGARRLPARVVLGLAIPVVLGQVEALRAYHETIARL